MYWLQHISRLDVAKVFAIFTKRRDGRTILMELRKGLEDFVKKCT